MSAQVKKLYVGPIAALYGRRALVREYDVRKPPYVLAQFDDLDLIDLRNGARLGGGWHEFHASDFVECRDIT